MKYPRTYHLSFSPEIHSDDKVCNMNFVNGLIDDEIEIVITEKLDGGNTCCSPTGLFARSHAQETICPSFNYIKNVHYYPNLINIIDHDINVYGENLYAIHSIEYTNLKDYFYVFNILDRKSGMYNSYYDMVKWATDHNMKTTPLIYDGLIKSMEWLKEFLGDELKKPSELGGEKEGFVVRVKKKFHKNNFSKNVFKYVRKGHVQTDQHWSKNWKKAKLNNKKD